MPVYFVQAEQSKAVKIGWSLNIDNRFIDLQVSNHETLKIIRTIPGDRGLEKWLHVKFSMDRIRGEWFKFNELMLTIENSDFNDSFDPYIPNMNNLDWTRLVKDIIYCGFSEAKIAEYLSDIDIETTQATINRIKLGVINEPKWTIGDALIQLHKESCLQ